jgi:hypothetical protein
MSDHINVLSALYSRLLEERRTSSEPLAVEIGTHG